MKYKIRSGIVYRKMVDEHYLISTGDAASVCPVIQQINDGAAYYWNLLEQEKTEEEILDIASSAFGAEKESLRPGLEKFLQGLEERRYISCADE